MPQSSKLPSHASFSKGGSYTWKSGSGNERGQSFSGNLPVVCECSEPASAPWYALPQRGSARQMGEMQGRSEMERKMS